MAVSSWLALGPLGTGTLGLLILGTAAQQAQILSGLRLIKMENAR